VETTQKKFDLVGRRRWWFTLSAVVILAGLVRMYLNYQQTGEALNFGIDFTGGALYTYQTAERLVDEPVKVVRETRQLLHEKGIKTSNIQVYGHDQLLIRTQTGAAEPARANELAKREAEKILGLLQKKYGKVTLVGSELVGPVIGAYLKRTAIVALLLGCGLILGYITIRYNIGGYGGGFRFALAAVVALIHDVLVLLCVFAFSYTEVNTPFVAAVLTIIGYSINDSVVIFDRIRENLRLRRGDPFAEVVNDSLWQTMTRSVNTSLTTMFTLMALFIFGGATIKEFSLALLAGIVSGAYSSIFTASPLIVGWELRRPTLVVVPSRAARPVRRRKKKVAPVEEQIPAVEPPRPLSPAEEPPLVEEVAAPAPEPPPTSATRVAPTGGKEQITPSRRKKKSKAKKGKKKGKRKRRY